MKFYIIMLVIFFFINLFSISATAILIAKIDQTMIPPGAEILVVCSLIGAIAGLIFLRTSS